MSDPIDEWTLIDSRPIPTFTEWCNAMCSREYNPKCYPDSWYGCMVDSRPRLPTMDACDD